jgi:hypothetical protein
MKSIFVLVIAIPASAVAAIPHPSPTATLRCVNPVVEPGVASTRRVGGEWLTTFEPVQFDVNLGPGPRTLHVTPGNNGVCTVTLTGRGRLQAGSSRILSEHPRGFQSRVVPRWNVRAEDPAKGDFVVQDPAGAQGTATWIFSVRYRR